MCVVYVVLSDVHCMLCVMYCAVVHCVVRTVYHVLLVMCCVLWIICVA